MIPPPGVAVGSGYSVMPWLRMQVANFDAFASIFACCAEDGGFPLGPVMYLPHAFCAFWKAEELGLMPLTLIWP